MLTKRFFEFFPPPYFLLMPAAGFNISDRSVRFSKLAREGSRIVLESYGETLLPEGLISSGEIRDHDKVLEVLVSLKNKYNLGYIHASLPEQKGFVLDFSLQTTKKREFRGSIELMLPEHVPLPPQDSIFDYYTTDCEHEHAGKKTDVGVTVMPQKTVDDYVRIFHEAGLSPLSFELEAHAIARVVIPRNSCDSYMVIDIGANRTGIFVVSNGVLQTTFTVAIGGNLFTQAVARSLGIPLADAKRQKEEKGFDPSSRRNEVLEAAAPTLSVLRDEIHKHHAFWETHTGFTGHENKKKIKSIILCGGEINVPGLREYLASDFDIPFQIANPWQNLASFDEYIPPMPLYNSLRYTTAIGLALRSFYK